MILPVSGDRCGDWILNRRASFCSHSVASMVSFGFESYARILHPAWKPVSGSWIPVRWSEVARLNAVQIHARIQWEDITGPNSENEGIEQPFEGSFPAVVLRPLRDILVRHTNLDLCWLAVWDGWDGAPYTREYKETAKLDVGGGREYSLFRALLELIDQNFKKLYSPMPSNKAMYFYAPKVPWWKRKKFKEQFREVEVREPPEWEETPPDPRSLGETASLIWANDRSWLLNQGIDLVDTFIGGSASLIEEILASPELESWAVNANDSRFPDDWKIPNT